MKIFDIPKKILVEYDDGTVNDVEVGFEKVESGIEVYITATKCHPKFVRLFWEYTFPENTLFMGDAWERTYADSEWRALDAERVMPWYFLAKTSAFVLAMGVRVRPSSFVGFRITEKEIICELDVRCGGIGVVLSGRRLHCATLLSREYKSSPYAALKDFCARMCDDPLLPKEPIYGGNNWYYAYGNSSREDIRHDAELQAMLSDGLSNRPFMVVDDGWEPLPLSAPWVGNDRFEDMALVAEDIHRENVRSGIWVRYLIDDRENVPDKLRIQKPFLNDSEHKAALDPSHPEVLEIVKSTTKSLRGYGFELIKHDFSTYDIFHNWGRGLKRITPDHWSFYDRTRTSAEIVKNFYKTVLDASNGGVILGCNTVSHLSAGLVHISRTGDDTSGYNWQQTVEDGVNSLGFRIAQHNRFYAVDADCVGIIPGRIDWALNRQWLKLLSRSGTPLFISCAKGSLDPHQFAEVKEAYKYASVQSDVLEPLDWLQTKTPERWKLRTGEELKFDWKI